jgi:glycosyltransferase involved in cell wall biosynthesis
VIFLGRVAPQEVPLYYHLADVSVDPVYDDGAARGRSPLKLFESWACGVPFVSGDVGDRRKLLGQPPAGLLTKPGDPVSLGEAILRVLGDPDLGAALCRRGRERVRDYNWGKLARNLESEYRRSLG